VDEVYGRFPTDGVSSGRPRYLATPLSEADLRRYICLLDRHGMAFNYLLNGACFGNREFHETIIPNSPVKPIRIWMEVADRDNLNSNVMRDNMHDWVVANENMAKVLAAKGYHYQFVFARNAGHTDGAVKQQTLPEALEWLWQGYPIAEATTAPTAAGPVR
jgi:hypothetical protein